ncbi:MAG: hypothetical protein ACRDJ2_13780 [Actinomycetota bacterium]
MRHGDAKRNPAFELALREAQLMEAAASVSLSHGQPCGCVACRAIRGDRGALAGVRDLIEGSDDDRG